MAAQRKPTPGPWAVFDTHPKKACFYIDRHDQIGEHAIGEVAVIYTTTDETKRANAALIAAAPELYAALQRMVELVDHAASKDPHSPWCNGVHSEQGQCEGDYIGARIYDEARAALRKADGDAP